MQNEEIIKMGFFFCFASNAINCITFLRSWRQSCLGKHWWFGVSSVAAGQTWPFQTSLFKFKSRGRFGHRVSMENWPRFPITYCLPKSTTQSILWPSFLLSDNPLEYVGVGFREDQASLPLFSEMTESFSLLITSSRMSIEKDFQINFTVRSHSLLYLMFLLLPKQREILNFTMHTSFKIPPSLLGYLNFSYISISLK